MLAGFVWREGRARFPLLPLGIFRLRTLTAANGVAVLISMIMGAVILLLSLQLQDVEGLSPLSAGLAFLPLGTLVGTVAVISPRLAGRFGLKPVIVTATALMTVGTLLLVRVTAGLLNSAQQAGGSLGIALLVTLASEDARVLGGSGKAAQASAYGFAAAAVVGLIATILAVLALPGTRASRGAPW